MYIRLFQRYLYVSSLTNEVIKLRLINDKSHKHGKTVKSQHLSKQQRRSDIGVRTTLLVGKMKTLVVPKLLSEKLRETP